MTDLNNSVDLEDLYGPLYKFSDAKPGQTIRFNDSDLGEIEGTVLWCVGPEDVAGTFIPAHYIVDARNEWPETVFPSDVIAKR